MNVKENILGTIGNTPLVELKNIALAYGLEGHLLAKIEGRNPGGSAKDRIALSIIEDYEKRGLLNHDSVIIEETSGNTGIGLAMVSAVKGYHLMVVMPENMSEERKKLIQAYGAELVLTPKEEGMEGAVKKVRELHEEIDNSVVAGQFDNPENPLAHYLSTGPEIFRDTDGNVDIIVSGIGTGGTITGIARYLKEKKRNVKVIGVEPASSPFLSERKKGPHKIQGIGAGFKPEVLDLSLIDQIVTVKDDEAISFARMCAKEEGILIGFSGGAALKAGIDALKENEGKTVVVIFPDSGERYLSTELFEASDE